MSKWQVYGGRIKLLWAEKSPQYPWRASAPIGQPKSDEPTIDEFGDFISAQALLMGFRLWAFKDRAGRDRFVERYGAEMGQD